MLLASLLEGKARSIAVGHIALQRLTNGGLQIGGA